MPQAYHGEPMQLIEAGHYDAVITHVICLGHQAWKDKEMTKFWIEFWIPSLNISKPLSNFGIHTWLSPSKPPFVGFFELIFAAKNATSLSQDEAALYDLFELAGKPVVVEFQMNEKGYMNITGIQAYTGTEKLVSPEEPICIGVEDFKNNELLDKIPDKARQLIWQSREFMGDSEVFSGKPVEVAEKVEIGGYASPTNPDDVPF